MEPIQDDQPRKYRKKPVAIEAMLVTLDSIEAVCDWIAENDVDCGATLAGPDAHIDIDTLEGSMRANLGDYVIQGVKGEFYPCKPDIFDATYGPV